MNKYKEPSITITQFSEGSVVTTSGVDTNEAAAETALQQNQIQNCVKQAYSMLDFK